MVSTKSENSQPLIGLARRRAFELYLRTGRKPDAPRLAERKDTGSALAAAVAERGTSTSHYVWRTMLDKRVRWHHAEREGHVFARAQPPVGGPPGTEPNCRCWAEPYYGDPAVPDALQPLTHAYHTDPTGSAPWASIETLTRSDGSLAQSVVLARDGTQIRSAFSGTLVSRQITLPTGDVVRVNTSGGVQSIYRGDDPRLLLQSAWTARGPRVIRARQHLAFLGDEQTVIDPEVGAGPGTSARETYGIPILPNLGGLIALALVSLHSILQAAPASQGLAEKDRPILVPKAWALEGDSGVVPIMVDALPADRVRQACKYLPDVQQWTDSAALRLAPQRATLTAQVWGTSVHFAVKQSVETARARSALTSAELKAELSLTPQSDDAVYGTSGSTRLDILENRRDDLGAVCVYDVKTGIAGLTVARVKEIASLVRKHFGDGPFFIIEIRPAP